MSLARWSGTGPSRLAPAAGMSFRIRCWYLRMCFWQTCPARAAAGEELMTTLSSVGSISGAGAGILDREHTIAKAGFNRWLVPPAALCIHLCIGMSYGLSVFWLPLSRAVGIDKPAACASPSMLGDLFATNCDWQVTNLLI